GDLTDDAVAALASALEVGRGGQAYNVVDDQPATWEELFTAMAAAVGADPPRRLPRWLTRLVAPYAARVAGDTSMRVSNARPRTSSPGSHGSRRTTRESQQWCRMCAGRIRTCRGYPPIGF